MAAEKKGVIVKLVKLALGWFWLYFLSLRVFSISAAVFSVFSGRV